MPSTSIYQFSFLNNGLFDLKKLNIGRFQGPELTLSHFKSTISRGPTPFLPRGPTPFLFAHFSALLV
jgi:hypothetical protein